MPEFDAATWLDEWLATYPWPAAADQAAEALVREALALPKTAQVALHKQAVARLPGMRAAADEPFRWHKGSAVYELACRLYGRKLAHTEQDVCALLLASKHDCGHGADVKPPFELAVRWARANGVTKAWLAALATFVAGLKGLSSVKALDLKTKGALVLLLDEARAASTRCYSERFRAELFRLPTSERAAWERLVLYMGTGMGVRLPKDYDVQARALTAFLGVDEVLARLGEWLPAPEHGPCRLETAGSHLLKHFVWLLLMIASDPAAAPALPACDALVERLIRVDFQPAQLGKKVALACAVYFAQRPLAVSRRPHEVLLARVRGMKKESYDTEKLRQLIEDALAREA